MNQKLLISIILSSLVFLGCSEKNVPIDEASKQGVEANDMYAKVIAKSIKDCKEHNIVLDEKRTNEFMRQSPKATIEKAAKETENTSKKLCQFFEIETSLKKVKSVEAFTSKVIKSCEKVGVILSKDNIHKKVKNLPFFIIKKGLKMQRENSLDECKLMEEKSK